MSWKPLFAFLANHIHIFLRANDPGSHSLHEKTPRNHFRPLGFTFSFTVHQTSINTGTLVRWDKGFDIPSAIGRDPCRMLQEGLDALGAPVLVSALVNDSVATYMAQQYVCGGRAVLGGIFGTGTNGAYLEDLAAVGKIQSSGATTSPSSVVINTEWGGFDDDDDARLLPVTQYDLDLDQSSLHPSEQRYEKMLSGMYLGELFRRGVLSAYEDTSQRPSGNANSPLFNPWQIPTSLLSLLAEDSSESHVQSREALETALEFGSLTMEEVQGMRQIAAAISKRAARLAGIAISAVILKTGALQALPQPPKELPAVEPKILEQKPGPGNVIGIPSFTQMFSLLSAFAQRPWPSLQRCICWKRDVSPEEDDSKPDETPIYVGLDGTLAAASPGFVSGIRSTFRDLAGIGEEGDQRIRINLLRDGSSIGTALVAQAAASGQ